MLFKLTALHSTCSLSMSIPNRIFNLSSLSHKNKTRPGTSWSRQHSRFLLVTVDFSALLYFRC